jgi:hypothetical protein
MIPPAAAPVQNPPGTPPDQKALPDAGAADGA